MTWIERDGASDQPVAEPQLEGTNCTNNESSGERENTDTNGGEPGLYANPQPDQQDVWEQLDRESEEADARITRARRGLELLEEIPEGILQIPQPPQNQAAANGPINPPPPLHQQGNAPNHAKKTRAAIRIASLNIKGGGASQAAQNKWKDISEIVKYHNLSLIALQETHLTPERCNELNKLYQRIQILNSPNPENPGGKGGVAVVLNKSITRWREVTHEETIPGRVLTVDLKWGETSSLRIVAIYAPSGNDNENAALWETLNERWNARGARRPDVLLGDLNMVECGIDRMPARPDRPAVVEAFREMRTNNRLIDGYRDSHLGCPPEYSFRTQFTDRPNRRSRIDRIYVKESLITRCYEWKIVDSGLETLDHYMVNVFISTKDTPYVGNGRSTIADFILEFKEIKKSFADLTLELEQDILELSDRPRTVTDNAQVLWKKYKVKLKEIARDFSRKRASQLEREIKLWEGRKTALLATPDLESNEDQLVLLDEVEGNITSLLAARRMRSRTSMEAKYLRVAETNTRYDYQLHREKQPRDIIPRLMIPGSSPPKYETSSRRMVQIATEHHDTLQDCVNESTTEAERNQAQEKALASLTPKLSTREKGKMGRKVRVSEVKEAISKVAAGKASGLDGVPAEVWKHLAREYELAKSVEEKGGESNEAANMAWILSKVFNDIADHGVMQNTDFSEGWLCPLYKKKDRADINNYRPITVLNTDYKIFTTILTLRVSKVATKLIHPDQAGFIKGRSIFDQTELIRLVMETTHRVEGAIVCLDQEKAYDKIQHDFLWKTLEKFNFPPSMIKTIQHLYAGAETAVILNGVVGQKYKIRRSVRQGDPLSCLLFDLAIESLASMLRISDLRGLRYPEMEGRILSNLFADDTTVFLDKNDNFEDLLRVLREWCKASGAKFNIPKTVIIPLGNEDYRDGLRRMRKLTDAHATTIPDNMHIADEGEPVRILGAYYGHNISQDEIWKPVVEKIEATLRRWSRNRPTIRGLVMGNNTMVGGFTQYLTRVQGMPKETLKKIKKITDDFVYAKDGEQKANTIATSTLHQERDQGGLKLLDIEARNEAIDTVRLRTYLSTGEQRPQWCKIADLLLGEAAVRKYRNVGPKMLRNPFTQQWRVNLAHKGLPENLRRMMKVAYKYGTRADAVVIPDPVKHSMPYWYHVGNKAELRIRYGDKYGECQRTVHNIYTTGQMLAHARKLSTHGCSRRGNCKCEECKHDRANGCENPTKCRKNAERKLDNLTPKWDPRVSEEEMEAQELIRREALGSPPDGYVKVQRDRALPRSPEDMVRIFTHTQATNGPQGPEETRTTATGPTNGREVEVYTDGSCHDNGTANAKCGSGLWYTEGDDRNTSARIGPPHEMTNNTGELIAVLLAIQKHKNDTRLMIASDSQYTIDVVTRHAGEWLRKGFDSVKNKQIVAAIVGEILTARNETLMRKVKGHSGDIGNDGADAAANVGARLEQPTCIDLSAGESLLSIGAAANAITQAEAYRLIKGFKPTPARKRTERMIARTQAAVEGVTGTKQRHETLWKSLHQRKKATVTQKFSAFAWKGLHEGHKVGRFWEHTTMRDSYMPCEQCNIPVESMEHIMLECSVSGQTHVWNLAKEVWRRTGIDWPYITWELILGTTTITLKDGRGKVSEGRSRLFQMILSESAYLIWLLRCEWRIGREADPFQLHHKAEVEARWRKIMTKRLRMDWALTNVKALGKKALRKSEVNRTWYMVQDCSNGSGYTLLRAAGGTGGLVGSAVQRRPPGRNR